MGSLADYAENKILDHIVGKTSFTMPTAYVGLSTSDVTDAGTLTGEPSGSNYGRVTTSGTDWTAASGGATSNAVALTFNTASGSWGTIAYFFLSDGGTPGAGNVLAHGQLTVSKAITTGDTPSFAIGDLDITLE